MTPISVGPGLQGGIMGVASRSTAESLRLYNGRGRYNEWTFVAIPATVQAGAGARGGQAPGVPGRGGRGAAPPGRGGRGEQVAPPGRGGRAAPDGRRGFPQPVFPGLKLPGRGRQ
ncbi:MAG: hypothetical protein HY657_11445 [Acidobacteria bacterium]|nr:hypothetical protein [Acidobacteriota bacterium]